MARRTIPELVAAIRASAGLTQEALARELGVSFPTVNSWERGRSTPRASHIEKLNRYADSLGIHRGLTVLVIDDDPISCSVFEGMLASSPNSVTTITAQNGSEGLLLCGMHRPDLVLLDILMPGIDGLEVARRLKTIPDLDQTQVVFITAATDKKILDPVRDTGHRVLIKPVHRDDLGDVLDRIVNGMLAAVRRT